VFAGDVAIKPATTRILNRFGFRATLVATTATLGATIVAAGFLARGTPAALIVLLVALSGAARSVGLTAYTTLAFSEVPDEQMRYATALAATAQQLAAGLAIAVATLALRAGGSLAGAPDAYRLAFALIALVALAACAGAARLHPAAGDVTRSARKGSERAAEA
jgi:MFS family permease